MTRQSLYFQRPSLSAIFDNLQTLQDPLQKPALDWEKKREVKVSLKPNFQMRPGLFLPDPQVPFTYQAHPNTIKALRKDIFVVGEDFEEFTGFIHCESCREELDLQFWICCPFCNSEFKF